ncbi:MAG: DUF2339 domain-containing protein [Phycisphaerales bacterium]
MTTSDSELNRRLAALELRVEALEGKQGAERAAETPAAAARRVADVPPAPDSPRPADGETLEPTGLGSVLARKQAAVASRASEPVVAPEPIAPPTAPVKAASKSDSERTPPATPTRAARAGTPSAGTDALTLERLIGGRWFAAIGALIVIAGLGLSLKLAWDAGWLRLSETARVLGVAGFGAVLVMMGEAAYRKLGRAASAGLFGAGVGAMFVAAWGAHGLYGLIPVGAAFMLMAAVCGLGIAIALRANLVSIGVLSVLGGYLTPVIARAPDASAWALPIYLLGLAGVGVGLGVWRQRFGAVRVVSWAGTVLVGTLWISGPGGDAPMIALGFVGAAWAAFQLDIARRVRPTGAFDPAPMSPAAGRMLLGAALMTGWASFVGWWLGSQIGLADWMVPAALGVACALGAIVMTTGLSSVRELPRTDAARFGVLLTALAGSELFVALALGLSGWIETTTWLVSGTLIVLAGRSCRARGLMGYGLTMLGFGVLRAVAWEPTVGGLHAAGYEVLGLVLTGWTGLLAFTAAALWVSARAIDIRSNEVDGRFAIEWHVAARLMAALAVVVLALGLLHDDALPRSVCVAWAMLAVVIGVVGRVERRMRFELVAPFVFAGAMLAWVVAEVMPGWFETQAAPGLHPGLWIALALAPLGWVVMKLARLPEDATWAPVRAMPWVGGVVLIFAATSLEVARSARILMDDAGAQGGAVSTWWGVFGVLMIVLGTLARRAPARWFGLGLMMLAAGKAVVFDLSGATPGVRVASFLALGVLMMLVAAGYLRVSRSGRPRVDGAPSGADAGAAGAG